MRNLSFQAQHDFMLKTGLKLNGHFGVCFYFI